MTRSVYKKIILLAAMAFIVSSGYVYALGHGSAGSSGGMGGENDCDRSGTTNAVDSHGNPVEVGCSGGCSGGDGGGGGGGTSEPVCVPCTTSCISEPNECGQVQTATGDPCCGSGCYAPTPPNPTFIQSDGTTISYGQQCQVGDKDPLPQECKGSIGCAGECVPACESVECLDLCYSSPTTTPTTTPPTRCIVTTSQTYTVVPNGDSNNYLQTTEGEIVNVYQIATVQTNIDSTQTTYSTSSTSWGEPGKFKVSLVAAPKVVKKGRNTTLILFMKNLLYCDVASSDGLFWPKVGKDTPRTGALNIAFINTKIFGETEFRVVKCYINNNISSSVDTFTQGSQSTTTIRTLEFIPVEYGWRCVTTADEDAENTLRCVIETARCVRPDGTVEDVQNYSLCIQRGGDTYEQQCSYEVASGSVSIGATEQEQESSSWLNTIMGGAGSTGNVGGIGGFGSTAGGGASNPGVGTSNPGSIGFFGGLIGAGAELTEGGLTFPVLPPADNDVYEKVYLAPDWREN